MQSNLNDPFESTQSTFSVDKSRTTKSTPGWVWLFVVLCGVIPIVALGGVIPVVIGIGGASICLTAARGVRKNPVPELMSLE